MKIIFNIKQNPYNDTDYIVLNSRKIETAGTCFFSFTPSYGGYVLFKSSKNYIIYDFNNNIRDVMKIFKANTKLNFKTRI